MIQASISVTALLLTCIFVYKNYRKVKHSESGEKWHRG